MSSTTTPTTFSDLYTDTLNSVRASTADSAVVTIAKRYINDALHDLHVGQNWPWAERRAVLKTHATYSTGTVAISLSARTTVTGTDTLWATAVTGMGFNNARAGGKFIFNGEPDDYAVSTVTNDTSITLADAYIGSTALSGASYLYYEDEYALASDFWRPVDQRSFSDDMAISIISRQEFYRQFPRNHSPSQPQVCTFLELGPGSSTAARPRILFHPPPDAVYNIPYRYVTGNLAVDSSGTGAANLSGDTDEPIIPLRYRRILVLHAAERWYRDRKDDQRAQEAGAAYVDLFKRMTGDSFPERDRPRLQARRHPYLAGVAGPRGGRTRYDGGLAFDQRRY